MDDTWPSDRTIGVVVPGSGDASAVAAATSQDAGARFAAVRGGWVEGLYSAGELGSMDGRLDPAGGAGIAECLAFGRIAGRHAAAPPAARR